MTRPHPRISGKPGYVQSERIPARWWIRFMIGPVPVRFAVVFTFIAVAIAAYSLSYVLPLTSDNSARLAEQARDRHAAIVANTRARYDDCESLNNRLRAGLRRVVREGEKEIPLIRHAFPGLPPEFYRKSYAVYALELRLFANDNCTDYALEAIAPPHRAAVARDLGLR